jgi:hypothetical protein
MLAKMKPIYRQAEHRKRKKISQQKRGFIPKYKRKKI